VDGLPDLTGIHEILLVCRRKGRPGPGDGGGR
jgi:hypothetical protein